MPGWRSRSAGRRALLVALGAGLLAAVLAACGGEETTIDGVAVPFDTSEWPDTDFTNATVPLDEFVSSVPRDGIPPIDDPVHVPVEEAAAFLEDSEPLAVVARGGDVRAYPLQIMIWHEIVNDVIGGEPIAVTYCPLCNSTVAFRRELDGEVIELGNTGMLRNADMVMYDRATETWWQQLTAEAQVGELAGRRLETVPSQILSRRELERLYPDALVLSRETGHDRPYGTNPNPGYDTSTRNPLGVAADPRLPPMERVASIQADDADGAIVYPFSRLAEEAPINDTVAGREVVVFYDPDVASALDAASVAEGRAVGAAAVFERGADGRALTFEPGPRSGTFRDAETGSTWTMDGRAIEGGLRGTQLAQIVHDDHFWFAVAAFFDDPDVRE